MKMVARPTTKKEPHPTDADYDLFQATIRNRMCSGKIMFRTNAQGVWQLFLRHLTPEHRQHYNCHCCRKFIEDCGGLVFKDGTPVLWPDHTTVPEFFRRSVRYCHTRVSNGTITGVFIPPEPVLGNPKTGEWTHLHCVIPPELVHNDKLLTASQKEAKKLEEFGMIHRALEEYPLTIARKVVRILDFDEVDRGGKAIEQARWFVDLHENKIVPNYIWTKIAEAPEGWAHVKSSMIGSMLDDIIQGYDFEAIRNRWNAKMHPLKYMRPTTVKAGNIEAAEKIVEKLGVQRSLKRRFAHISDITECIWTAAPYNWMALPAAYGKPGMFRHLKPSPTDSCFEDFKHRVLKNAKSVEVDLSIWKKYSMFAMVTAVHPDAPLIFQWDNLLSWYHYVDGSYSTDWNLSPGWQKVTKICYSPSHWGASKQPISERSVMFLLDNCRDLRYTSGGALFPEMLRSEFHSIRSTLEAYSKKETLGNASQTACGISLTAPLRVKVDGTIHIVRC